MSLCWPKPRGGFPEPVLLQWPSRPLVTSDLVFCHFPPSLILLYHTGLPDLERTKPGPSTLPDTPRLASSLPSGVFRCPSQGAFTPTLHEHGGAVSPACPAVPALLHCSLLALIATWPPPESELRESRAVWFTVVLDECRMHDFEEVSVSGV